jgi:tetraacyldisaccharide 4'-kinase
MKFKKPKFWDLKKPSLISYLLLPLTIVVKINKYFQSFKITKKNDKIRTVCVGNIYLGGTGKTPTVIKLFKILKKLKLRVAVGKKFYSSQQDERIILKNCTNLLTSNDRKSILKKAINHQQEVLIFDDGLQDKNLYYDLKIVCFDSQNWVGNGLLIPSGPLREKLDSLKEYDCVLLKDAHKKNGVIFKSIKRINNKIKVFHTYLKVSNLKKSNNLKKFLIFSGIGNPNSFKKILIENNFNIAEEMIYPDHYNYKKSDIIDIKERAKKIGAKIITTEKDYVKILPKDRKNIDVLKIKLNIKNEKTFIKFLKSKIYDKN